MYAVEYGKLILYTWYQVPGILPYLAVILVYLAYYGCTNVPGVHLYTAVLIVLRAPYT